MHHPSKKWLRRGIRIVIAIVVAVAIAITFGMAAYQLKDQPIALDQIGIAWLLGSALMYVCAQSSGGIFWHRLLIALRQDIGFFASFRAFWTSQLGKYVPGKAIVVVIRSGEVRRYGVPITVAATSAFVETLTWISVGAVIGAALVAWLFHDQWQLGLLAAMVAVAALLPTFPPLMRRILAVLRVSAESIDELRMRQVAIGWLIFSAGWVCNGLSLFFVVNALPSSNATWTDFPICLASICLSFVVGFFSFLPGGIGARELVMVPLLGGRFGLVTATLAVILLRVISIASELVVVAIMYQTNRWRKKQAVDAEFPKAEIDTTRRAA